MYRGCKPILGVAKRRKTTTTITTTTCDNNNNKIYGENNINSKARVRRRKRRWKETVRQ